MGFLKVYTLSLRVIKRLRLTNPDKMPKKGGDWGSLWVASVLNDHHVSRVGHTQLHEWVVPQVWFWALVQQAPQCRGLLVNLDGQAPQCTLEAAQCVHHPWLAADPEMHVFAKS